MGKTNTSKIGIDVGSTTVKIVVLDEGHSILYKSYNRHKARFNKLLARELQTI